MTPPTAQLEPHINNHLDDIVAIRHDLHAHPQICYEETYASQLIQRELTTLDIPFTAPLAETGVVAWITPTDPAAAAKPAVALRADIDALPITEQNDLPYQSVYPGFMHACGHDGHTATLLGAARVLNALRDALPQPVKLIFQPAEEGGAGADRLIQAGTLTDTVGPHAVSHIFGLHNWPNLPIGQLATKPGPILAATDCFTITLTGPGGHAAFPHTTPDTILAAAQTVTALQSVVSRYISPTAPAVLSVTMCHGGDAENVIPDRVTLAGTIRTVDTLTRNTIIQRATETVQHTAATIGCEGVFELDPGYPPTLNDAPLTAHVTTLAADQLGQDNIVTLTEPVMGGEDFAYYGQHVPASFVFLGSQEPGTEPAALHTPRFNFNDRILPDAIQLMCRVALSGYTPQ